MLHAEMPKGSQAFGCNTVQSNGYEIALDRDLDIIQMIKSSYYAIRVTSSSLHLQIDN